MSVYDPQRGRQVADKVEAFVREVVVPYERDPRAHDHAALDGLGVELKELARAAGVLTPHILADGTHLSHRETAMVLKASGLSPLGPLACNVAAPDEGNMFLIGKVGTAEQKARFLQPMVEGRARSAFLMTEPAEDGGAGSDPTMMITMAARDGEGWVVNGRKAFITGYLGAGIGILMANTGTPEKMAATMFLIDLPNPAIRVDRVVETIDSSMPGGHAVLTITDLRLTPDQVLGEVDLGFKYAQVRLAPARLTHCMRWYGAAVRANEIATAYACSRKAFGRKLIEHEGVGFPLADNLIDLKTSELMIDWCAGVLDSGSSAISESSMTKAAVSEALFRVADRSVQVMGGTGVSQETVVEQIFREIRSFRIYDGPTEVHKWSLANKIARDFGGRA